MYIPVILATIREGRQSGKPAKFILDQAKEFGFESEIIDIRDYISEDKDLSEKLNKADGYIIVSPEYNHGYPGELKMVLDRFLKEYSAKPVGFCGVSIGGFGGTRAVEQLKLYTARLEMVPLKDAVYFSFVDKLFDENGNITDSSYKEKAKPMLEKLKWYAQALKNAKVDN